MKISTNNLKFKQTREAYCMIPKSKLRSRASSKCNNFDFKKSSHLNSTADGITFDSDANLYVKTPNSTIIGSKSRYTKAQVNDYESINCILNDHFNISLH